MADLWGDFAVAVCVAAAMAGIGLARRWVTAGGAFAGLLVSIPIVMGGWVQVSSGRGACARATGPLQAPVLRAPLRGSRSPSLQCMQLVTLFVVTSLATKYRARDKVGTEGPVDVIAEAAQAAEAAAARGSSGAGSGAGGPAAAVAPPSGSRARGAAQVLAAGAVPALLCAAALAWGGGDGGMHSRIGGGGGGGALAAAYAAFIATICGDTLASELGVLAPRGWPVVLLPLLRRVHRGTDGGVSLAGTAASLAGGALIGAWGGPRAAGELAVWGGFGSLLDSLLGAAVQAGRRMSAARWRRLNVGVNAAAGALTAAAAAAAAGAHAWLFLLAGSAVGLECAAVAAVTARVLARGGGGDARRRE